MTDEELRALVDALALQAIGWSTEAEQKLRNNAWQIVAKRAMFLRKESEIATLEARLAQLKENT
jgi:polyhydroxyalkanoate synthesis regulator phasin